MKITLGSTFYNNPDYLIKFVDRNIDFVDEMIIVDDGSSKPIEKYLDTNEKLRLFKVTKDYGFNSHGCRNLIAKQSSNDAIIFLDLDREFLEPEYSFKAIKDLRFKSNVLYRFIAHTCFDGELRNPHNSVNDYLIHRKHFFSAGGYDEELMGMRTGDREYFVQLSHFGYERVLHDIHIKLTRRPSIGLKDGSASKLDISLMHPKAVNARALVKSREIKPDPSKKILTFDWIEL